MSTNESTLLFAVVTLDPSGGSSQSLYSLLQAVWRYGGASPKPGSDLARPRLTGAGPGEGC
jgi:hypothetical protein